MAFAPLTVTLLSLGLTLSGAEPPVQRPSSAPLKIAQEAPSPEVAPERAPTPVAITPLSHDEELDAGTPVPAPTVAPEAGTLPSYTSTAPTTSSFERASSSISETPRDRASTGLKVPRDGSGQIALGALGFAGGGVLIIGSAIGNELGSDPGYVVGAATIGSLGLIVGSFLTIGGHSRKRRYQQWADSTGYDAPRQGMGLAASGGALITVGAISGIAGTLAMVGGGEPFGITMITTGVSGLVIGSVLTTAGVRRNKQFNRWRTQAQLTPSLSPIPGGAQVALRGRF